MLSAVNQRSLDAGQPLTEKLERSLEQVIAWVQARQYRAYEPADGNSSVLFALTRGRVSPMRVLQQVVLRAPVNIRPALGVRPHESAIGRGYMAWGYLVWSRRGKANRVREEARACLDWLIVNRAMGHDEFCWGDPYRYATRSGRRPRGEPLLIWSALIGQAFLEAFEVLQDTKYLEVAKSVGRWILALPVEQTTRGVCLSYIAYRQNSIHNANAMGAAFLARLGRTIGSEGHLAIARNAMLYTCARQRPDGSWWYAEEPKYHWIDNFHTGYNLSALSVYRSSTNDGSFDEQFANGARFFRSAFFELDGRPKYLPRPHVSGRHPVRRAGNRDPHPARKSRPGRVRGRAAGGRLDDHEPPGRGWPFPLSRPRVDFGSDADDALGAGNDGQGARGRARKAERRCLTP